MNYKYDLYVNVNEGQQTQWVSDFLIDLGAYSAHLLNYMASTIYQDLKKIKDLL